MNIAHYVSTFQLRATQHTESIKEFDDREISSIHENSTDSALMMLEQWRLPEKLNLIEKMVQTKNKEDGNRSQDRSQKQQKIESPRTQVFCVGFSDSPHILALLYSVLYLMKQNEIGREQESGGEENRSCNSQQYQQNYLYFKYEIYLLAQKILSPQETIILVQNMSNLYYCTQIIAYLTKNQKFIFIFFKLFRFATKSDSQATYISKKSRKFEKMFNFSKKFAFLLCNLYDFEQSFQYFKGECSLSQPNYDIMELCLKRPRKQSTSPKTINKLFIVNQCQCYFIIHFKGNICDLNQEMNDTPDNVSLARQQQNTERKLKSNYSTPKFILSRSKKKSDENKQIDVEVEKFDQFMMDEEKIQINSLKSSSHKITEQVNSAKSSNAKIMVNPIKEQQSTEFQSQVYNINSNSKFSENTNARHNLSPKYFGSSNNLTQIPEENSNVNVNVDGFQINKKLQKVNLYSCSRFAQLLTSKPYKPITQRQSANASSSGASPEKKYKNLIQKYQKKMKRFGPIYESLNVGKNFKGLTVENPTKKIRETLNMKLQNYKNFTAKNIAEKLKSPRNKNISAFASDADKNKSMETLKFHSSENLPFKSRKNISEVHHKKFKTQTYIKDIYSPTSMERITETCSNEHKSPQTHIITQTIITRQPSPKRAYPFFPRKITFNYVNRVIESPQSRQRSISPNSVNLNQFYPHKSTCSERWIPAQHTKI